MVPRWNGIVFDCIWCGGQWRNTPLKPQQDQRDLNWKKCEVFLNGFGAYIAVPDGSFFTCRASISYLGNDLDASGAGGGISHTIGWSHKSMRQTGQGLAAFQFARLTQDCLHTMWLNNAELRKLMGLKQCVFVPSFVPHLRTSNVFHKQQCCEKPLQTLVRILGVGQLVIFLSIPDDGVRRPCIFQPNGFILESLSAPRRVAPNKLRFPKCTQWRWKLLKVLTCYVIASVKPLAGDRKFTPFVSCQVNTAIRFLCPFLTIHEANESMKNITKHENNRSSGSLVPPKM